MSIISIDELDDCDKLKQQLAEAYDEIQLLRNQLLEANEEISALEDDMTWFEDDEEEYKKRNS